MTPKQSALKLLDIAWSVRPAKRTSRIIYYHSVHPSLPNAHRSEAFDRQMAWLKSEGYQSVKMSEIPALQQGGDSTRPWVAITFDDGYRDNLEFAVPILQSHGLTATLFVVAGLVGHEEPIASERGHKLYPRRHMLTESDLRELAVADIEIGSHSLDHQMASTMAKHASEDFAKDLRASRAILERAIGNPVTSFAYPNGQKGAFSRATRSALQDAGFQTGATTMWGAVRHDADNLELPRCEMASGDTLSEFVAKMTGRRDYRWIYQRALDRSQRW